MAAEMCVKQIDNNKTRQLTAPCWLVVKILIPLVMNNGLVWFNTPKSNIISHTAKLFLRVTDERI